MEAMNGETTDKDLHERLTTILEQHKLSWNKLIIVTTDKSANSKCQNYDYI
jgi:hypothetical protein